MEDRKLPWWRRALNIALDGIRSGFGLFSKPHKDEAAQELETVSGREEATKEKTQLVEHSAAVEPIADVVIAEEPVGVAEAVAEPVAEAAVEPAAEAEVEPVAKVISEPAVDSVPELEGAQDPPEEIASEQDATPHEEIVERETEEPAVEARVEQAESASSSQADDVAEPEATSEQAVTGVDDETAPAKAFVADEELRPDAVASFPAETEASESTEDLHSHEEPETEQGSEEDSIVAEDGTESAAVFAPAASPTAIASSAPSFSEALEAALVSPPEATAQDEKPLESESFSELELPAPAPEPEAEATIETIAIDEPAVDEAAIDEPAIDEQMIDESSVETAPAEPVEEIAVAVEAPEESAPESEVYTEQEPDVAAAEESEISLEDEVAAETGVEVAIEEESTGGAIDLDESTQEVPTETAEAAAGPDEPAAAPEAEIESLSEAALDEEPATVEESISEEAISSVELSEPAVAEVAEETPGQPDMVGDESQEEGPAAAEPVPEIEEPAGLGAEPAAEEVAEEAHEPVDIPMELNEPIPEQPTEPTEANESVPVEEAVEAAAAVVIEETAGQTTASEMIAAEAKAELADEAGPTAAATPAAPTKPFIKLESRDNESDLSPFSVVVSQVYDGPLDLLLDLIRKQDIDIYDIPIARITAQFLAYVNQLKATDVDVAGEFIYTASLLIHIKSKMLLPRAPSGGDDAAEDPRRELVERLLEHERFKNAAQMLQQKQMLEAATWTNPGIREFQDDTSAEPEIAADTVDLVRIFRDILERARNRPVINVEEDSVTVGQMIQFLARRLTMEDKPVALRRLLSQTRSERALIAMFLALLELVRLQAILLRQDVLFSEIFIKKHVGFESVMNEGAASVHDDWR